MQLCKPVSTQRTPAYTYIPSADVWSTYSYQIPSLSDFTAKTVDVRKTDYHRLYLQVALSSPSKNSAPFVITPIPPNSGFLR